MTATLGYENIDEYRQKSEVELIGRIKGHLEQFFPKISDQMVAVRVADSRLLKLKQHRD
jgi:hypothetical protein